jgi:hypothetical protein
MRLFQISEQFNELYNLSEDIEVNENGEVIDNRETLSQLFNEMEMELSEKLENSTYIIKELVASEQALKDEAKRLNAKAKVLENRQTQLKELMKIAIESSGQTKIKTDKFNFSITHRKSLNYDDVSMFGIDNEFIRTKQELDKNKIKEYVKAGGVIDGLKEVDSITLNIR